MFYLRCITCGSEYEEGDVEYTCPRCGMRMGTLEVLYDYDRTKVSREDFSPCADMWQFRKILPFKREVCRTHLRVGSTPLYSFPNIAKKFGLSNLLVKYDGSNPTGSYKDRASAVAIAKAVEYGYKDIYCASTGNAASSLAGLAASSQLKAHIFVPASAPRAKISQIVVYGADLIAIDGTYDDAFDVSLKVGSTKGWFSRNSAINPYLLEGKKTGALEIIVQNNWNVPDTVIVPVGDGTVISSIYKGFYDFKELGLINKIPRLIGVQATGADRVVRAFENGSPYQPNDGNAHSVADSISVGKPRDVVKACKYVKNSCGFFIRVSDQDIVSAVRELAGSTGIFAEPAGAAPFAALRFLFDVNQLSHESVCLLITGNGLKDVRAVENVDNIKTVKPDVDSVLEFLEHSC